VSAPLALHVVLKHSCVESIGRIIPVHRQSAAVLHYCAFVKVPRCCIITMSHGRIITMSRCRIVAVSYCGALAALSYGRIGAYGRSAVRDAALRKCRGAALSQCRIVSHWLHCRMGALVRMVIVPCVMPHCRAASYCVALQCQSGAFHGRCAASLRIAVVMPRCRSTTMSQYRVSASVLHCGIDAFFIIIFYFFVVSQWFH
jgi:hypothetical protein